VIGVTVGFFSGAYKPPGDFPQPRAPQYIVARPYNLISYQRSLLPAEWAAKARVEPEIQKQLWSL
jgi:hypothetical protein